MDLNHILLLVSIASPLIVLVQLRAAERKRGWRLVSAAVLVVTLAAWLVLPTLAGYLGGCFWLAFLFLPAVGLRRAADLVAQQRYSDAWRVMNFTRFLHPTDDVREQAQFVRALELAQRGGIESAITLFSALRSDGDFCRTAGDGANFPDARRLEWLAHMVSRASAGNISPGLCAASALLPRLGRDEGAG